MNKNSSDHDKRAVTPENVNPALGQEFPAGPEHRAGHSPIAAYGGEYAGLDPMLQWRSFSEKLRQRRLAREHEATGQAESAQAPIQTSRPADPTAEPQADQPFQQAYEADTVQLEAAAHPMLLGLKHHLKSVRHPVPDAVIQSYQPQAVSDAEGHLPVSEVMSREVTCVLASTSIEQLASLCNRRGFSGVPIVNAYHELVGIVTMSDLLKQLLSHEALSTFSPAGGEVLEQKALALLDEPVRPFMRQPVITVRPETPVSEACALMRQHGIRRVVVTQGKLVRGIFSAYDAVGVLARAELRLPLEVSGDEAGKRDAKGE